MAVAGIIRSWSVASVCVVIVSISAIASGYAFEGEATVELLPNDLISDVDSTPHKPDILEAHKVISTPQEVLRNQIVKIAQNIQRTMDLTRRHMKLKSNGKRDLGQDNYLPYVLPLMACFVKMIHTGVLPESMLKKLVKPDTRSGINVLASNNNNHMPPMCPFAQENQRDLLSKNLKGFSTDGFVTDLTGGRQTHTLTGLLSGDPVPMGVVGTPDLGALGQSNMATGVAAGAVSGVAVASAGSTVRNIAPDASSVLGNVPLTGGPIESIPMTATRPLAQHSDLIHGYQLGYNTGRLFAEVMAAR